MSMPKPFDVKELDVILRGWVKANIKEFQKEAIVTGGAMQKEDGSVCICLPEKLAAGMKKLVIQRGRIIAQFTYIQAMNYLMLGYLCNSIDQEDAYISMLARMRTY